MAGQSRGREVGSGCDGRSSLAWSVGNSAGRKIDLYLERPKLGSFATLIGTLLALHVPRLSRLDVWSSV